MIPAHLVRIPNTFPDFTEVLGLSLPKACLLWVLSSSFDIRLEGLQSQPGSVTGLVNKLYVRLTSKLENKLEEYSPS